MNINTVILIEEFFERLSRVALLMNQTNDGALQN